jgi:hypothetical protein
LICFIAFVSILLGLDFFFFFFAGAWFLGLAQVQLACFSWVLRSFVLCDKLSSVVG